MPQFPEIAEVYSLIAAQRYDEALALCARILAARPLDVAALQAQGIAELKRGRYAQAVESLERALAECPDDAILLNNCGEAYRLRGDNERAFECFKHAIQVDGAVPMPHVNMGLVMRVMGKAREAEHFFKNAILIDPGFERAHFELAELYREEGHVAEAIERYRQALEASPESARTQAQLGALFARGGKTREALDALSHAVRLDPLDWRAQSVLARTQFELCHERDALANYSRAVGAYPALSPHDEPRIAIARRVDARDWAERGAGQYWRLARSHWLRLPQPRTIPPEAASGWTVGRLNEPIAPEVFLCRLAEAEVLPRDFVVLTGDGCMLIDGLVNWAHHYEQRGRYVVQGADDGRLLLDLPRRVEHLEEPCAVLGGTGDLFDWLFGGVARLWGLEQQARAAGLPVIVPEGLDDERRGLLESLGVGAERLRPLPEDRTFQCRDLYVPSLPIVGDWISPLAVQFLRRRLSAIVPAPDRAGRRLYLSRTGLSSRRVANETELLPLLLRHGFEVVTREGLTLTHQIELFHGAQAIVAFDDEVLANLVVSPQGAKIGVIVARGIYRPRAYFISAQCGHDFTYLQAEPQFDSHPVHAECDVVLPPESLAEWLSRL